MQDLLRQNSSPEIQFRTLNCAEELLQKRSRRDEAFRNLQQAMAEVLQSWHKLKLIRQNQGWSSSSSHLVINAIKQEKEKDLDEYQREIGEELEESAFLFRLRSDFERAVSSIGKKAQINREHCKLQ